MGKAALEAERSLPVADDAGALSRLWVGADREGFP
jgi:hypothetical protein